MLPLSVGARTSFAFGLDIYHVVASLEDGWDACGLQGTRYPSPLLLGLNQARVRMWLLKRLGDPPPWLMASSNPILACFPTARSERCAQGHAGYGEFGPLRKFLSFWVV